MKKSLKFIICMLVTLSLVGCGQVQSKKLDEMSLEIESLKAEILELNNELNVFKEQDFDNVHKDGEYDCHNPYGIQKVKFLSSRVIYIYGVMETNDLMYNNYYLLNMVDKDKYEIVDEVVLPDSLPKRTIQFLKSQWRIGINYMKEVNILDSGKTLTINEPLQVCTFVKSN